MTGRVSIRLATFGGLLAMVTAATLLLPSPDAGDAAAAWPSHRAAAQQSPTDVVAPAPSVRVVMTELTPFVANRNGRPSGFYAEIWQTVAADLGVTVEIVWVDRFGDLLLAIDEGRADVAVAPLTPSAEREPRYDFTSAVVSSGPQLAYHQRSSTGTSLLGALFSRDVRRILIVAAIGLSILAHLIWLVERDREDPEGADFDPRYLRGIWDGFWWATVTVTTVGYGDKAPRSVGGRLVALLAMFLSLFLVGAFVSQVTESLQAERGGPPVASLADIDQQPVGVVDGSSFARYLENEGVTVEPFASQGELFDAAEQGTIDLVVSNPYALATDGADHGLSPVGEVFYTEFETFGLAQGSPWREPINRVLADLQASGEIEAIIDRWVPES